MREEGGGEKGIRKKGVGGDHVQLTTRDSKLTITAVVCMTWWGELAILAARDAMQARSVSGRAANHERVAGKGLIQLLKACIEIGSATAFQVSTQFQSW